MPNQHVTPRKDGRWSVKPAGGKKATSTHPTQREAFERAREHARRQKSEVFTHGKDGKFRDRNSYGNDPFPPPG